VWVAGSTREGEEALILDALAARPPPADVLTVIVPRHPQRFAAVAQLLRERRIAFVSRSEDRPVPANVGVVLGDSMGEMFSYYTQPTWCLSAAACCRWAVRI
jgi:3-deoxy-D-manno-octulosonic-acid transferase